MIVSFMNPQDCLSNDTSFASSSVSMLDLDLHHVFLVSIDVMVGPSLVREIEDSSSLVVSSPSLPLLPSTNPSTTLSHHCQPIHLMVTWGKLGILKSRAYHVIFDILLLGSLRFS